MVQSEDDDPGPRILRITKALRRARSTRAGHDTERFGPGAHCVICGDFGRWDSARGVTLCQRHLDAVGRGEL